MKRSVNQRLKLIESLYSLKQKIIHNKPKHYLDLLAHLGIIRPLFLHQLLEIRNNIEHEDRKPPSKKKCTELVDIVWYFLKSTDSLVALQNSGFIYEDAAGKYFHELNIGWGKGDVDIRGWFPSRFVSGGSHQDFVKLKAIEYKSAVDLKSNKEKSAYNKKRSGTDIYLSGRLMLTPSESLEIYRKIFSFPMSL